MTYLLPQHILGVAILVRGPRLDLLLQLADALLLLDELDLVRDLLLAKAVDGLGGHHEF